MPPEMFFGGSAYYFATLKKYNTLVQKKPPDPNWNKEIFSGIFLKLEMREILSR